MKNYPKPEGRWIDILVGVLLCAVAVGVWASVYFALYFSICILEGV